MGFWNFVGGQNIPKVRGSCPVSGGYFLGGGQFSLCPFSHSEKEDFKNSKIFACGILIFIIYYFRLKMGAGIQVDIDFNTESKCSCSRSSFFTPQWALKTNQTHYFLFYPFGGSKFRGAGNFLGKGSYPSAFYADNNNQSLLDIFGLSCNMWRGVSINNGQSSSCVKSMYTQYILNDSILPSRT